MGAALNVMLYPAGALPGARCMARMHSLPEKQSQQIYQKISSSAKRHKKYHNWHCLKCVWSECYSKQTNLAPPAAHAARAARR